jgi:photosystem II stability/assembly factor-like uncharacterized protein
MRLKAHLLLGVLCVFLILSGCQSAPAWRWERAEAGLPRQTVVLALALDPVDPNHIWAGYYAPDGLATSQDGGETWTTGAQGLVGSPVFDLLFLPGGSLLAATRDGLLESTDGGASWGSVAGSLPSASAFSLATDGAGRVYVGLDDAGLYVGGVAEGQWMSLASDEPHNPGWRLAETAVLSIAVSPDGTQVYAGTAGQGVLASRDAGRTWGAVFQGDFVPNLAFNPSFPEIAVASLRDRLIRTYDGGESWEVLPIPWARDEVVSLLWLADPLGASNGTLWAGSGRGRIYYSQDEGDSWTETGARVPTQGGVLALAVAGDRLLAGAWTGIFASDDGGQTWTYISPSLGVPNVNALLAADAGLLSGTRTGLFRWQPTTQRWARVPMPGDAGMGYSQFGQSPPFGDIPAGGVATLAGAPSSGQVVYAGAASGGFYRSDDGGVSWTQVPSELEVGVRELAVAPNDVDRVYMVAAWERMYESNDGGESWRARWTGLGVTTEAISLAIDPLDPRTLYLGADTGLYRSRYGGEDWRPVGRPLDDQTVLSLVTGSTEATGESMPLYIGATRGAYRSYDYGDSVERWGHGLEDVSVTALSFDPNDSQAVYAGTAYAGLYQSMNGGETWRPIGPPELNDEVVEAIAWGPAGELFIASAGGVWMGKR